MTDKKELKLLSTHLPVVRQEVTFYVDVVVATRDVPEALRAGNQLVEDLSGYENPYACDEHLDGIAYGVLAQDLDPDKLTVAGWGMLSRKAEIVAQTPKSELPGLIVDAGGETGDTWEWDGTDWTLKLKEEEAS